MKMNNLFSKTALLFGMIFLAALFILPNISAAHKEYYTSETKIVCDGAGNQKTCYETIYSYPQYVYENNKWKNYTEAQNLKGKGYNGEYLEIDSNYPVNLVSFNATSLTADVGAFTILNDNVPLRIWKKNETRSNKFLGDCESSKNPKGDYTGQCKAILEGNGAKNGLMKNYKIFYDKYQEETVTLNLFDFGSERVTIPIQIGDVIEFGPNSTSVALIYNTSTYIFDGYITDDSPGYPTDWTGNLVLRSGVPGNNRYTYISVNLSKMTPGTTYVNATLSLHYTENQHGTGNWVIANTEQYWGVINDSLRWTNQGDYNTTESYYTFDDDYTLQKQYLYYNFSIIDMITIASTGTQNTTQNYSFLSIRMHATADDTGGPTFASTDNTNLSRLPKVYLNFTVGPPEITLKSPANGTYYFLGTNTTFNCSARSDANINLTNLSLYIDGIRNFSNLTFSDTTNDIAGNITPSVNLTAGSHNWTCYACDSDNTCTMEANRTIVATGIISVNYNATVYETSTQAFSINASDLLSAVIYYDGTPYTATIEGSSTNQVARVNISIPLVTSGYLYDGATLQNKTFYWNISGLGGVSYEPSIPYNQSVNQILIFPCNATNTRKIVNLTFKDEVLLSQMNATMDSSTWYYSMSYGAVNRSFTYTNSSHVYDYTFCDLPVFPTTIRSKDLQVWAELKYSHSSSGTFPQRTYWLTNVSMYNGTMYNYTLYLLNYNNGVTSSYQVITVGNQVIPGAYIKIERYIGSTLTKIAEGTTDSAGTVTFFLNPNYQHTITVSKTGYLSQVVYIYPSQSTYTITMGTTSNLFYPNNTIEGITYYKWPPSGMITYGMYNFTFEVYSRNLNIYNCSFNITYRNGTLINSSTGCNDSTPNHGGVISMMVNTSALKDNRIIGGYYYMMNSTLIRVEGDAVWMRVVVNSKNYWTSIRSVLNDSLNLEEWGGQCPENYTMNTTHTGNATLDDEYYLWCMADDGSGDKVWTQTTDFSKFVFFFLFLAIIMAALNFYTGYDTAYPGAFLYVLVPIIFIMSAFNGIAGPGFFYMAGATRWEPFNNWIFFINVAMLAWIYFTTTNKRYQAG
jgi:hypothetical protein